MAEHLFDLDSDYQKLRIARDLAAYRALGHIDAAICYCKNGDTKMALSILTNARALYEAADKKLQDATSPTPKSTTAKEAA